MSFLEFICFFPRFSLLFRWNFTAFSEKFIRSLPADTLNLFGFYLEIFSFSLGISITFPKISQLFSLEFLSFSPSFYPLLPYTFSVFFFLEFICFFHCRFSAFLPGIYLLFPPEFHGFFSWSLSAFTVWIFSTYSPAIICLYLWKFSDCSSGDFQPFSLEILAFSSGNFQFFPLEIFRLFSWIFFLQFPWKFTSIFPRIPQFVIGRFQPWSEVMSTLLLTTLK